MVHIHPGLEKYSLNYKFQPVDTRDKVYVPPSVQVNKIVPRNTFSLSSKINTILDQGNLGACVSNAFAQYIHMGTTNNVFISRLYHYYVGRLLSKLSNLQDTGLYIRDACKIITQYGACQESLWAYNTSNFSTIPPLGCFQGSKYFYSYSYLSIPQTTSAIISFLTTQNKPVIFGLNVYTSFMSTAVANTGIVPMPNTNTEILQGGHCMLIVGYDNTNQLFQCVNSWGPNWGCSSTGATTGSRGFCYMPYAYITSTSLCSDFFGLSFSYPF